MADRETNLANFARTTLSAEMGASDTTANVDSTSGFPSSPAFLVIEPDSSSQREVVLFDGTFSSTAFSTTTTNNRYLSGSAAGSGLTHPTGSAVICAPLAQHIDDVHDRVDADAAHDHDTDYAALAHAARHQDGGADEVSVAGLSGELADDQPPKAHTLGGASHSADTLADLNTKVSDATLDDSSATRDPTSHGDAAHSESYVLGSVTLTVSGTEPTSPATNDLWVDTA